MCDGFQCLAVTTYCFIYISNESSANVFFDNLQVRHDRGRIIEENHYYAHGLKIAAISSKAYGAPNNNYGYQGDFSEMDDNLGWNDFELRSYDPQIGRFLQNDPYDQFASAFVGMGNDPGNGVDPSGGFFGGPGPGGIGKIGAAINAAAGFGNIASGVCRVLSIAINAISLTSQGISLAIIVKQPYYDSPEAAAIGWGKTYNNLSIKRKKEFHSFIYKIKVKGKIYYSYTTTIQGGAKTVKFKEIDKRYKIDLPDGAEYEYTIHSHGNDSWGANDDENFSQKPRKTPSGLPDGDVQVYEYYGLKGGFLTTPRGMVKVSRNDEGRQLDICDCLDNDPEIKNPRKKSNKIYFDNFRSDNLRGSPNRNLTPTFFSQEQIDKMIK